MPATAAVWSTGATISSSGGVRPRYRSPTRGGRSERSTRILCCVTIDVTDATFQTDVLDRSTTRCRSSSTSGPSGAARARPSGPILEKVIDETEGQVVLAKVDVDANPPVAQAFQVQSIPAVFAAHRRQDRRQLRRGPGRGSSSASSSAGCCRPGADRGRAPAREIGDEASLRAGARARARRRGRRSSPSPSCWSATERPDEALELLARIPETPETRRVAALARSGGSYADDADVEARLDSCCSTR